MVRFLVVRFSSIGDIVLTTPVLRHLKEQVEGARVHYLTKRTFAPILESNPYVDRVHVFDGNMGSTLRELKETGIDYIIDLHNNARSSRVKLGLKRMDFTVRKLNLKKWLLVNFRINRLPSVHMVDRNLDTIRNFIESRDDGGLDYFIPDEERVDVNSLGKPFNEGYFGLSIGARHTTKKLPVESLIELCRKLEHPVIILGGPDDRETGEAIVSALPGKAIMNACGMYSIHQSASLVEQCRVLITHDTGLMHIGAALGKKIISVWGNTIPEFGMFPYRAVSGSTLFEVKDLSCRPCSKIGHNQCPKKHFRCMMDQDLKAITRTAKELFDDSGRKR
jgi:ADP-heptose:LPS heptosyltransferase